MNVQNRKQFNQFLNHLKHAAWVVMDTETNGLRPYAGTRVISYSFYFPEFETSYNLPFRHGVGTIDAPEFDDIKSWQGKPKKLAFLREWFTLYAKTADFENIPLEWEDELRDALSDSDATFVFHNARFDLHMLKAAGMPIPDKVIDTMISLHLVMEDWRGIEVVAPFIWSETDVRLGRCNKQDVGRWARDDKGELLKRKQNGNRQLKWVSAMIGLEGATDGEEGLQAAIDSFKEDLLDFIMADLDNPLLDDLRYKKPGNPNQRQRIADKLIIDAKSQMWMLPSSLVSHYAELDVILTWGVYNWCLPTIEMYHNEKLHEEWQNVNRHVAWEIEQTGFKLDIPRAVSEIEAAEERIKVLEQIVNDVAYDYGFPDGVNLGSPQQLLAFLNSGVLNNEVHVDLPEWFARGADLVDYYEDVDPVEGTSKDALFKFEGHIVVRLVLEWRQYVKSSRTYLQKWVEAADDDGFVHGSMNADGTVSGRFSSSGDAGNLQNIPERGGYRVKTAIVAPSDEWLIVSIDYGQLEARLAAWIAEGQLGLDRNMTMTNLFNAGVDMHAYTRDTVGVRDVLYPGMSDMQIASRLGYTADHPDAATDELRAKLVGTRCRYVAKTMNFGLLYGGTEYMLSKLLKIDRTAAKVLVDRWRDLFPAFTRAQQYYMDESLRWRSTPDGKGKAKYSVQPISGRVRKLHKYPTWLTFTDTDGVTRSFNPQEASAKKVWNNVVQGLGGYLTPMSLYNYYQEVGHYNHIKPFAIIHDAIDAYVHKDHLKDLDILVNCMVEWDIDPKLTVDVQISKDGTWQNMEKFTG